MENKNLNSENRTKQKNFGIEVNILQKHPLALKKGFTEK